MRRNEFAVIGDTQGVIVHAPVAKRAAGRLAELAVGILLRRADGKRLSGIFRRQRMVLLRLMVVQLGAQAPAAAGAVARLDARLQEALSPLQLGLRQQTAVPDLVLDAVELIVVRQAEQLVERDAKEDGDVRQELDVRRRRAALPLGNGLRRDGQLGGQRLLRQISGNAKLADLFPDLHVRFLRSKSCSAAFWIQHTTRRAKRKAPRERERATGRRVSRGETGRA